MSSAASSSPVLYLDLDQFQERQRHARPPRRRRAAQGRRRAGCAAACATIDTVARVGGDEFAIIQTGVERAGRHRHPGAAHLRGGARALSSCIGHAVMIDTSIGIAIAPSDGTEPNELLKNADMALYRRQGGRPRHLPLLRAGHGCAHEGAPRLELALRHGARRTASSSCTISRSSACATTGSPAARRCSAGTIPSAA